MSIFFRSLFALTILAETLALTGTASSEQAIVELGGHSYKFEIPDGFHLSSNYAVALKPYRDENKNIQITFNEQDMPLDQWLEKRRDIYDQGLADKKNFRAAHNLAGSVWYVDLGQPGRIFFAPACEEKCVVQVAIWGGDGQPADAGEIEQLVKIYEKAFIDRSFIFKKP